MKKVNTSLVCAILASAVFLLIAASASMGLQAESHFKSYKSYSQIDAKCGGLKGAEELSVYQVHYIIDGTPGSRHRHDGSHDKETIIRIGKKMSIPEWITLNVYRIHILDDVIWSREVGRDDGVNGYPSTDRAVALARQGLNNIRTCANSPDPYYFNPGKGIRFKSDDALVSAGKKAYEKYYKKNYIEIRNLNGGREVH